MTMAPGSCAAALRQITPAAQQPAANTRAAAMTRPVLPKLAAMTQAKGRAANEPQVPGIPGSRPAPNHVPRRMAGCWKGRPRRVTLIGSKGQSDRRDGLRRDAFATAGEAELLSRRRLDADAARVERQDLGDTRHHR